ncbi:hypothetical protein ACLOJK_027330 [Asimina triloba]
MDHSRPLSLQNCVTVACKLLSTVYYPLQHTKYDLIGLVCRSPLLLTTVWTLSDSMEAVTAGDFDLGGPQSRLPAPDLDGRPPDLLYRIYRYEICHGRSDEQVTACYDRDLPNLGLSPDIAA